MFDQPHARRKAAPDISAWAAEQLATIRVRAAQEAGPQWTPKAVGEQLIEALRWARYSAGRTGPGGLATMRLPETILTPEDRLELGWDAAVEVDPDDLPPMRIRPSAAAITRHLSALEWPARYLVAADLVGSARMVGLWAACRAYNRPFNRALDARGIHRAFGYRLRDKGLSLISQGLDRDKVPVDPRGR